METEKRKRKIVVVAPYFYPKIGGLENYALHIARRLHVSGDYCVTIVTTNHTLGRYSSEIIDGMRVHRLPISFTLSNTPINLRWGSWLRKIFADEAPDLIHVHSPVPFLADVAASVAGPVPVVVTYHAGSMLKNRWPIDLIIGAYERTLLNQLFSRSKAIVAVSRDFANQKLPHMKDKTQFIQPGVSLEQFTPTSTNTDTKIITYVGRIEYSSSWKGIEPLLRAMVLVLRQCPDAKLEFVGDGDAVDYYKRLSRELGIAESVAFSGPQTGSELAAAYARSSVVVLPSTTEAESFGTVLLEAMASGRPVIGSRIGGIPSVIDHEVNGLLVKPNDPTDLAEAIVRVLGDQALMTRFAEAGVSKAQQFSWQIQTDKYRNIFETILHGA